MEGVTQDVQDYIEKQLAAREEKILGIILRGGTFVDQIKQQQDAMTAEFNVQIGRVNDQVAESNTIRDAVQKIFDNMNSHLTEMQATHTEFHAKLNELNARGLATEANSEKSKEKFENLVKNVGGFASEQRVEIEKAKDVQTTAINEMKKEMGDWSVKFMANIEGKVATGDFGKGEYKSSGPKVDKKDAAIWKLANGVSKVDFRHWIDAVDVNLEAVHGFDKPDLVLNRVRRMPTEVTKESLRLCIKSMNEEDGVEGVEIIDSAKWDFSEKSRFIWMFLISQLSTDLHEKTLGIENKNGLELYRLIYNAVDALPENAEFHLDCQLTALPQLHALGVKNLKDLYGFRLLLKRMVAE